MFDHLGGGGGGGGDSNNRLIFLENNRHCFPLLFLKFNGRDLTFTGGGGGGGEGLAKFSASGGGGAPTHPPLGETLVVMMTFTAVKTRWN